MFRYPRHTNIYITILSKYIPEFKAWEKYIRKKYIIDTNNNYSNLKQTFNNKDNLLFALCYISNNNIHTENDVNEKYYNHVKKIFDWELKNIENLKQILNEIYKFRTSKINMSRSFGAEIKNHLLYNKKFGISPNYYEPEIKIIDKYNKNKNSKFDFEPYIELRIYQDSSNDDIKNNFKKLTELKKSLKNRNNSSIKKLTNRITQQDKGEYIHLLLKENLNWSNAEINNFLKRLEHDKIFDFEENKKLNRIKDKLNIIKPKKGENVQP